MAKGIVRMGRTRRRVRAGKGGPAQIPKAAHPTEKVARAVAALAMTFACDTALSARRRLKAKRATAMMRAAMATDMVTSFAPQGELRADLPPSAGVPGLPERRGRDHGRVLYSRGEPLGSPRSPGLLLSRGGSGA
jgi:hypothetical protein